jgi:hypothetical protein
LAYPKNIKKEKQKENNLDSFSSRFDSIRFDAIRLLTAALVVVDDKNRHRFK